VTVVHLQIERNGGDHHAGQPAEHEDDDEAENEEQRRKGDHLRPEVDAFSGRELRSGERDVTKPPLVRPGIDQEGTIEQHPAEQINPIAKGVQPRERDRSRPHLAQPDLQS
jgi:hypothetical protein